MLRRKKCLVLLSGGVDSAVSLWWAQAQGWQIATLGFFFPGRRKLEIFSARKLSKLCGSRKNFEVNLPFVDRPKSAEGCYIPKRNLMFYSIAASVAEKIEAEFVVGGHCRHDGEVFADASKDYLFQIDRLVRKRGRFKRSARLVFPFIDASKEKIILMGASLRVPFRHTWSCSLDGKKHCWKCSSCKERRYGFLEAGVSDPLYKNE